MSLYQHQHRLLRGRARRALGSLMAAALLAALPAIALASASADRLPFSGSACCTAGLRGDRGAPAACSPCCIESPKAHATVFAVAEAAAPEPRSGTLVAPTAASYAVRAQSSASLSTRIAPAEPARLFLDLESLRL